MTVKLRRVHLRRSESIHISFLFKMLFISLFMQLTHIQVFINKML